MNSKKILIAMNPFKENLGTREAGRSLEKGLLAVSPSLQTTVLSVSDGGDGFLDALEYIYDCQRITAATVNAIDEPITVPFLLDFARATAFIEMAMCNGLQQCSRVDFANSSSFGVGLLIKQAIDLGARNIVVGVGGSASTDIGLGLLQALGLEVRDKNNMPMKVTTGNLGDIRYIGFDAFRNSFLRQGVSISCLVDGEAYIDGEDGCWERTLNKGGTLQQKEQNRHDIQHLIPIIQNLTDKKIAGRNLVGCGGATAAGLYAFTDATLKLGSEEILQLLNIDELLPQYDLIISGEGIVDHTTFLNKLPGKLLQKCQEHQKPLVLVASKSVLPYSELQRRGVLSMLRTELDNYDVTFVKSQRISESLLWDCGKNLASLIA